MMEATSLGGSGALAGCCPIKACKATKAARFGGADGWGGCVEFCDNKAERKLGSGRGGKCVLERGFNCWDDISDSKPDKLLFDAGAATEFGCRILKGKGNPAKGFRDEAAPNPGSPCWFVANN